MKVIKTTLEYFADKAELVMIPKWRMDSYFLSMRLRKIISEYQIDCVFDVGANRGQYYDFLRSHVEYNGLIISFEPDPDNLERLNERQKGDNNWVILDVALGSRETALDFNIMKRSDFNSFLQPDNSETQHYSEANSIVKTIRIDTKRLDGIIAELRNRYAFQNVFLKLDTQGFDLEVFEGASKCLDCIRGVQTEVSVMPIYKNMPALEESIRVFKSKGFEVSGLYSLSESRFPHAVEFDCIYLPKGG